jgi:hypothetical protein
VNSSRAQLICRGLLYGSGSIERNTIDFIRYEQILVQKALDGLCRTDPGAYAQQIRHADNAIAHILQRRELCASSALATFVRATDACLARLGRMLEFSRQADREALGEALARSARAAGWPHAVRERRRLKRQASPRAGYGLPSYL